jgi:uncharacterized cupin superfamily protein
MTVPTFLLIATPAWHINAPVNHYIHAHLTAKSSVVSMNEEAAKQAWLARSKPTWSPGGGGGSAAVQPPAAAHIDEPPCPALVHAPLSFFAPELLTPKGTRRAGGSLVDVGEPEDFSRPLWKEGGASVGSWACTQGGWDSPKLRPTTEVFLVLNGDGSVTDVDGMRHPFGAGAVVVLPRGWSGRWDITDALIHKVWLVHDHPDVPAAMGGVVRAVVAPFAWFRDFAPETPRLAERGLHAAPAHVSHAIYELGPTRVGFLLCAPGSFDVAPRAAAEVFFVIDGVFFLTHPDGSAQRCGPGDTVVLPKGWAGHWDILEPVWKVWVEAE